MNKVFHSQLRKAWGVFHFSRSERVALTLSGILSLVLGYIVHPFLAIGSFALWVFIIIVHRRSDNHRMDHLDILVRRISQPPVWSLCEPDRRYKRFPHGGKA